MGLSGMKRIVPANRTRGIVLVFIAMLAVFESYNVVKLVDRLRDGVALADAIGATLVIYAVFLVVLTVLLFLPDSRRTRIALVATLMAYSLVITLFVTPREVGGDLVMIFAAVLAQKYGFLRRKTVPKIVGMGLLIVAIRVVTVVAGINELHRGINQMAIAAGAFPLAYWLFETDLTRIRRRADSLDSLVRQNAPFVEFGRNVTGVVHDLRNDVSVFRSFGSIMREIDESEREDALAKFDQYVKRLDRRVERIMFVTRTRDDSEIEEVNIAESIEAVVFVFRVSSDFKGVVDFRTGPFEPMTVEVRVQPLVRLLENVIRNSCEAIARTRDGESDAPPGTVRIAMEDAGGSARITIADDGPGFPFAWDGNILESPHAEDGYTSRSDGGGYGLRTIRRSAELLGATVVITSVPQGGVTTRIDVPTCSKLIDPSGV